MRLVRYSYPSYRTLSPADAAFQRSPWPGLENEIDRLFESVLGAVAAPAATRFAVDLYEDKAHAYVRAELPGLNREDIAVEVNDGVLTIAATRKVPAAEGKDATSAASSSSSRSVRLGDEVHAEAISAAYEHGVLTVTLPKRAAEQPKKIAVAVS